MNPTEPKKLQRPIYCCCSVCQNATRKANRVLRKGDPIFYKDSGKTTE